MLNVSIRLPVEFTKEHRRVVLKYFQKAERLTPTEWRRAFEAFDALGKAEVTIRRRRRSFHQTYERLVDAPFADAFIAQLLEQESETEAEALQQQTSFAVLELLEREGLYQEEVVDSEYLAAYCLYWWTSFARGYRFEAAVFRDLRDSGIFFLAHDLRSRKARRSLGDLVVLRQLGDVKHTTYFLHTARTQELRCDFYITRLYHSPHRRYHWVVLMTEPVWHTLNGEVTAATLETAAAVFPEPVRVVLGGQPFVIAPYDLWKAKVRRRQQEEEQP